MSFVLLSRQPLNGKTTYCNELIGTFAQLDSDVIYISLESLSLTREIAYETEGFSKWFEFCCNNVFVTELNNSLSFLARKAGLASGNIIEGSNFSPSIKSLVGKVGNSAGSVDA